MTNPSTGLRFDIYERVHLSEEIDGIEQLDEIEMVPHIQFMTEGNQAVLRGELKLTGKYLGGQDTRNQQNLEHSIPVEISMPLNRIQDTRNIGVEIENFDVDLLSPRSLKVMGVLSLRGVQVESSTEDEWNETEDEVVFVHHAEAQLNTQEAAQADDKAEPVNDGLDVTRESQFEEYTEAESEEPNLFGDQPINNAQAEFIVEKETKSRDEAEIADQAKANEMKIAFNSKEMSSESADKQQSLQAVLHSQDKDEKSKQQKAAAEDLGTEVNAAEESNADEPRDEENVSVSSETEWKSLFLNRENEDQQFTKMRMCIVQREETLDTIAERYSLKPREILLYNRLSDQDVSEGQIIYIPS